jgi:PhzF family phenazine biosynthesis protein
MTEIKLVNVFTHMGAGGNPCPIVIDASALAEHDMRAVAAHFGHESGFVLPAASGTADYIFRFWVPRHEMEMCGHATIGALWTLATTGHLRTEQVRIDTRSGPVTGFVDIRSHDPYVEITQPVGKVTDLSPEEEETVLAALRISRADLLDLPIQNAVTSRVKTLIPMKDVDRLNHLASVMPTTERCCEKHRFDRTLPLCDRGPGAAPFRSQTVSQIVGLSGGHRNGHRSGGTRIWLAREWPRRS